MFRCPVCKAEVTQGPQCRRCKADLTLLIDLHEQRAAAVAVARACIRHGEWNRAAALLEGVQALRADVESAWLQAIVALLRRDFTTAWTLYQGVVTSRSS